MEILQLINKRKAQRAKLTAIEKQLTQHEQQQHLTVDDLLELQAITCNIENKLEDIQDNIIGKLTTDEDVNCQIDAMEPVDIEIRTIRVKLRRVMSSISSPIPAQSDQKPNIVRAKLPKLDLPTFEGNYEDWIAFRDQFKSTIESNGSLSGCDKLQYLKSCLKGEAGKLISAFPITNDNFKDAWEIITERYDNLRELVFSILRKLIGQHKVHSENVNQLRNLVDTSMSCFRLLKVLKRKVAEWDDILVFIIVEKLDGDSKREWAKQLKGTEMPRFQDLIEFLEGHIRGLMSLTSKSKSDKDKSERKVHSSTSQQKCSVCSDASHPVFKCQKFLKLCVEDRVSHVKKERLCFNFLGSGHSVRSCSSKWKCKECGAQHNTLLHVPRLVKETAEQPSHSRAPLVPTVSSNYVRGSGVILATAIVQVKDSTGNYQEVRAFLDSGSETSLITEKCVQCLGLSRRRYEMYISGVGSNQTCRTKGQVQCQLRSMHNEFEICVSAFILPQVTSNLPSFHCGESRKSWSHLQGLTLADPKFFEPREVDILIGADFTERIITQGRIIGELDQPTARSSEFGWIISGPVGNLQINHTAASSFSIRRVHNATVDIGKVLEKFWEIESVPERLNYTAEEKAVEEYFIKNYSRNEDGRFIVPLPYNDNVCKLGESRSIAERRLFNTEKGLDKYPEYKAQYHQFMQEYLDLGHMEKVQNKCEENLKTSETYYLPHHFVLKENSTTTKLRVVFDGSCKSTTGVSLNECLMVGPTVQPDVFAHLVKFRIHPICLKSDIAKMYRQFLVSEQDSNRQRILWRFDKSHPIEEYRLKTVTYGSASAPFAATRALIQLARDEGVGMPVAARTVEEDFYVDDLLSGVRDVPTVSKLQQEISSLLSKGLLELRKWSSNSIDGVSLIDDGKSTSDGNFLELMNESTTNALGVKWNSSLDTLLFSNFEYTETEPVSKRTVLSGMSKVFDPLGIIAPFTVTIKIFFQSLWSVQTCDGDRLTWNDPIPESLVEQCNQYKVSLSKLSDVSITRCVLPLNTVKYELHGFSDASQQAYGAVVYFRCFRSDGTICVNLCAAKTRVAPVKSKSIPRLELCAALLLIRLISSVKATTKLSCPTYMWSDSEIVIHWLSSPAVRWQTFVANRVAEIYESSVSWVSSWNFIPGAINPADCASRGMTISDLVSFHLWWKGPDFLCESGIPKFSSSNPLDFTLLEERKSKIVNVTNQSDNLLCRFNKFEKLRDTIGWCLRFKNRAKQSAYLSVEERQFAVYKCVWLSQQLEFESEIKSLKSGESLSHKSKLLQLNPFIDGNGLLRVVGRLQKSELNESTKHQLIVSNKCVFSKLICDFYHRKHHHAGERLLLSQLYQEFWILRGRDVVRSIVHKCFRCRLVRAKTAEQLMGSLPSARVIGSSAFLKSGVDYAGPFSLRMRTGRGNIQPIKGYFCIFVCFAVKAVHIEPVTSMSTEAFISALKRFVSRRGLPSDIFSHCGTNFQGANNELLQLVKSEAHNNIVSDVLSREGIKWHFNSPAAPHHGGLWESAVKSVKFHMKRIIGPHILTLEEFTTLLCQVESTLISRPLTAMTSDPADFNVLTPGHFLVGRPLISVPQPSLELIKENRMSRWQRQEKMFQDFWKRWSQVYLAAQQRRQKWQRILENFKIGDLVSIKDETLPPLKWKLGRVISTNAGQDGLVRVVTLKTSTGEFKRPITKLVKLMTSEELNSS